ncbi:endonuclease [Caballeronia pedi]|uniref:Endonuclease n=1 Tax=Caballeronia pedi TaxID=1777141 RepID=A0A158B069_9BURK|nr:YqaJ viral recombinase family protein [Caballeronia pedi]SAK63369.1 endonuclease [Caballeronia pedi]
MNKIDRATMLATRSLGIGGSECAAACGLDARVTRRELFERKKRRVADVEDNERMMAGRFVEPAIANWASEKYDIQVYQRHQTLTHPKYPWMRANVDRLRRGVKVGVEIKNVDLMVHRYSGEWGEEGSSIVPEPYYLQCMHYMIVLDYPEWELIACVGGNSLCRYHIERDPEVVELVIDNEHEFWQCVERDEPPEFDYTHPSTIGLLKRLYPGTGGGVIELPGEAMHWHATLVSAKKRRDGYDEVVEGCKAHLLDLMGDAAIGKLPGVGEYRRKIVQRKGYEVAPTEYVDFRFTKPKGLNDDE